MRSLIGVFVLLATLLFAQDSKPQPFHIGKDSVGESLAVYTAHDPECVKPDNLQVDKTSTSSSVIAECHVTTPKGDTFTLADMPIVERNAVMEGDRIVALGYQFKRHDYRAMRAVFVKEFGEPAGLKVERSENGCFGEQVAWKNSVSLVNLQECGGKGDLSVAVFGLLDFVAKTAPAAQSKSASQAPSQ